MISLSYDLVLILYQIFKIISNISLKNMKHLQRFLLFMFTSTELVRELVSLK